MERYELKKRILDELKELQEIRRPTEADRGYACSLVNPRRRLFEEYAVAHRYTSKGKSVLDTAVLGLMGNMVASSIEWFNLELDTDEDQDKIYGLKDWLEKLRRKMMREMTSYGMYTKLQKSLTDACSQGTSAILMLDNPDKSNIRYLVLSPEEFYIKDDADGDVEKLYREYELTAMDALNFFGEDACPEVARKYDEDPYSKHSFIHAIFPRNDRDPFSLNIKNKKIASIYYSETDDDVVKESGFDEFPAIIHRWVKDTDSPYGGSPALNCIEALKIHTKAWNNLLKQDDMLTDPPIAVPTSLRGKFSLRPGKINYIDTATSGEIKPIYTGANHNIMMSFMEIIEGEIDAAFHTDYFRMLANRDKTMTAREVIEVLGERASILVPVVERLQREVLSPIVLRHFDLMRKAGRMPDPPIGVKKKDIELAISITGPLSQAMKKYHQAEGVARALEIASPILQLFQGSEDNIDSDELIRIAMDTAGMPQKVIREIKDLKKIRDEKRKALEAQQQQQAQAAEAEAYIKMKDKAEEGSPMAKMMQQNQAGNTQAMGRR